MTAFKTGDKASLDVIIHSIHENGRIELITPSGVATSVFNGSFLRPMPAPPADIGAEPEGKWVPAAERLPAERRLVLVRTESSLRLAVGYTRLGSAGAYWVVPGFGGDVVEWHGLPDDCQGGVRPWGASSEEMSRAPREPPRQPATDGDPSYAPADLGAVPKHDEHRAEVERIKARGDVCVCGHTEANHLYPGMKPTPIQCRVNGCLCDPYTKRGPEAPAAPAREWRKGDVVSHPDCKWGVEYTLIAKLPSGVWTAEGNVCNSVAVASFPNMSNVVLVRTAPTPEPARREAYRIEGPSPVPIPAPKAEPDAAKPRRIREGSRVRRNGRDGEVLEVNAGRYGARADVRFDGETAYETDIRVEELELLPTTAGEVASDAHHKASKRAEVTAWMKEAPAAPSGMLAAATPPAPKGERETVGWILRSGLTRGVGTYFIRGLQMMYWGGPQSFAHRYSDAEHAKQDAVTSGHTCRIVRITRTKRCGT